jgi:hypothetical protein
MKKITYFIVTIFALSLFAGCSEELNQTTFSNALYLVDEVKTVDYVNHPIYFSFKFPLLAGEMELKNEQVETFPYELEYKSGLFRGLTITIHDANSWEEYEDEVGGEATYETENFFFLVEEDGLTEDSFNLILRSFHIEELYL